ncbi:MAG TPA: DNA polymerase III subunit beta [Actinomycetes bacterium]|nr:DNA polymerase III subunit beta [Actinomycetes bacterium]
MKFRVERDVLAEAVAWAARSLPTRPPLPVLAGLMIEAGEQGLTLSSFDYEVSARVEVPGEVSEPGKALVSGRLLADITRSLPARPVDVATEESDRKVVVTCGSSRFTLQTLPSEDYPSLPDMPSAAGTLAGDEFAAAVAQVAIAAGRDDTLPVLTGIRIEFEGDRLVLAATDRYRLAVREIMWRPDRPDLSAIALVQGRSLADTARALGDSDSVTIALAEGGTGDGLIGFEGAAGGESRRTTNRLLDGEFPKYRALLPAESNATAVVETSAFIDTVKRVALVADRNTPIRLAFSEGEVVLEAGTGDEAQATEALTCEYEGEPITIAFNPVFLQDGLQALGTSHAELSFTTSTKPAVMSGRNKADEPSDATYRYLIMPVRLSG